MLHYPSYPDGRIIRPGDIYSFDAGTQLGLVLYVYPNEAIVRENEEWSLNKVYYREQIVSLYLSINSVIHLSLEDLYDEGSPTFIVNTNIEGLYNWLLHQYESGEMQTYQKIIHYWQKKA
ncbi:MAG: hypothetical protein IJB64_04190 [Akkermansia sp.]|nr:hypothetical protein [Akkermansia sp.]